MTYTSLGHKNIINGTVILGTGGNIGATENWDKNYKRCKKLGITTFCIHCHRPLLEGSGYEVNVWAAESLAPLGYSDEHTQTALMGSGCIREFLDKNSIKTYARKVGV
jgi:hypothetical protein